MTSDEIDEVLAALRAGRAFIVPFSTTLYPDTRPVENVLRAADDGFVLNTTYCEFAAGHGYSTEMHESEARDEAAVRAALAYVARDELR